MNRNGGAGRLFPLPCGTLWWSLRSAQGVPESPDHITSREGGAPAPPPAPAGEAPVTCC